MLTSSERVFGGRAAGAGATTLSTLLTARAAAAAGEPALSRLGGDTLTWGELDRRVTAVAAALRQVTAPGQRAAILIAPSPEHVVAFLGAIRAGLVAIPRPGRAAFADAEPSIVLATADTVPATRRFLAGLETCGHRVLAVDIVDAAPDFTEDPVAAEDVAFLQYPGGVMVTHANVVANARQAATVLPERTVVSWLPPDDPLGLLLTIALPVTTGRPAVLVDRQRVLADGLHWPDAATLVSDADPDLARLRDAVGASRVCHVLAEATALVAVAGEPAGQLVAIVDADGRRLPAGTAGELWVSGPNVARGYWNRPEESARVFCALITGDDEPRWWLRTGDIGVLAASGELTVTGRCEDLVAGHRPTDLEATATGAHPAVCRSIAFAAGDPAGAVLGVELATGVVPPPRGEVERAVRAALAAGHGLAPRRVVVLPPGGLPPTRGLCRDRFAAGLLAEDGLR
ncbi:AMP-binding protein [Amycolatopsis sp. OK19-0408]|uniref:AMP-binding protein n=1 Tax=Amycolatopsis iheyensis TaxID=2945988 RepID=A0A9X2SKU3_9PSEU|nr:AMP-binding protein [Amycolatopsis iheyensis]MCR6485829.1 AMP-binding protein [Amycolatopsis iheyensis]